MAYSMETRVSKLEEKTKNHEIRIHGLEDMQKSINDINLNIQKIALTQEGMLKTIQAEQQIMQEQDKRIKDLEEKPIKSYEKVYSTPRVKRPKLTQKNIENNVTIEEKRKFAFFGYVAID